MDVSRLSLLFLICWNLCLYTLGKALKSCRSRSSRCQPLTTTTTTTTQMMTTMTSVGFRCEDKGHFAVPGDVLSFYRCAGPGYEPCVCTCKNDQMCFDATRRRCRFAFLPAVRNCSRHSQEFTSRDSISTATPSLAGSTAAVSVLPTAPRAGGSGKRLKNNQVDNNEVLKEQLDRDVPSGGDQERTTTAGQGLNGEQQAVDSEALAARHAAEKTPPSIIEDNSRFPAWAISLLVLCVVIALVLVVMVLY